MNEDFLKQVRFRLRNESGRLDIDAEKQKMIASQLGVSTSYFLWTLPTCYGLQSSCVILWSDEYNLPSAFNSAFPIFAFLGLVYLCVLAHRFFWIKQLKKYEHDFRSDRAKFLVLEPNPPKFIKEDWRKTEEWFSKTDHSELTGQLIWTPMILCPLPVALTIALLQTA